MNTETISYDYGWLENKEGKKFAPKTTTDQVKLKNGMNLTTKIKSDEKKYIFFNEQINNLNEQINKMKIDVQSMIDEAIGGVENGTY